MLNLRNVSISLKKKRTKPFVLRLIRFARYFELILNRTQEETTRLGFGWNVDLIAVELYYMALYCKRRPEINQNVIGRDYRSCVCVCVLWGDFRRKKKPKRTFDK